MHQVLVMQDPVLKKIPVRQGKQARALTSTKLALNVTIVLNSAASHNGSRTTMAPAAPVANLRAACVPLEPAVAAMTTPRSRRVSSRAGTRSDAMPLRRQRSTKVS
jgi:hypothetical protein